ncbi:MAG: PAS domain S-box protein, partial [Methanogenium sp.]|nr:PAS domain S-box protein [Methanogenium sp.]
MTQNYSDRLISGESARPFIIGAASLGVILITVYCLTHGITIVFPHLYYIPVVLAAYWYRRSGVVFSAVLGGIYLIIVATIAAPAALTEAVVRVIVLVTIATVVAYLRERLVQEEEEYQTIFESTGTAMALVEEDMTISRANYKMEEMSGYSPGETLGKKKWADFVAEDDLERMVNYHSLRRTDPASAPPHYESRIIDSEGRMRDISLTISMIPGTKKSVASLVDITE